MFPKRIDEVRTMAVSYNKLWKILIDKKMNKTDLKKAAGVSWGVVTKMSKDETVSMDVLIKICQALDTNVGDIMDILTDNDEAGTKPTGGQL